MKKPVTISQRVELSGSSGAGLNLIDFHLSTTEGEPEARLCISTFGPSSQCSASYSMTPDEMLQLAHQLQLTARDLLRIKNQSFRGAPA